MDTKSLIKSISRFSGANILVVGDIILDEFVWGDVERISPEAPVPVVWAKKRSYMPGGAANVANNIASLGAKATLVGVVGKDDLAQILAEELKKRRISLEPVFVDAQRPTILKTRIISGHQQVVRVDWEDPKDIPVSLMERIVSFIQKDIDKFDAVIIEDYGKGTVSAALLGPIVSLAKRKNKIITVDPKENNFEFYRGLTAMTPNRKEAENAIRNIKLRDAQNKLKINFDHLATDRDIDFAGRELLDYLGMRAVLITLGEHGMRLFEKNKRPVQIDTVAQEVFDVSGAGDTVIATFSLALAVGLSMLEAAQLANFAAGIVVGKIGVATTNQKELLERL